MVYFPGPADAGADTKRLIVGASFTLTYSTFSHGSNDPPCHSLPPKWPGCVRFPCCVGGVKMGPDTYRRNSFSAYSCAAGDVFVKSASVIDCRASAGGL